MPGWFRKKLEAPNAIGHFQRGNQLQLQNQLKAAESSYRLAIAADPAYAEAHNCLGVVLHQLGRDEESLAAHERALALKPDFVDAHNNAAVALQVFGRLDEALAHYERALALAPGHAGLHLNLGVLLQRRGRINEALEHYTLALELQPQLAFARLNLAYGLFNLARFADALAELDRYLADQPKDTNALMLRGRALEQLERLPEANECYLQVLSLAPMSGDAYMRLGALQRQRGEHEEAIANLRRAVAYAPDSPAAWEHLLLALNYAHGVSPAEIYAAHCEFGRRFTPAEAPSRHANPREPDRKLRLGYVSGDFRTHPVAQFMEPILEHHDRNALEIFCYYTLNYSDQVTERIKRHTAVWREVFAWPVEKLTEQIRADGVDILVDLSGHTGHHRLQAFARKPAPVQATWLGYLNTTGLEAMDWRITDRHAAPEGFEAYHSERLYRLPDCQWCYRAPAEAPSVAAPPSARTGRFTFAAFSNPAKITHEMIELWCKLLAKVPHANLLVVGQGLPSIAGKFRERIAPHGIATDRITLQGLRPFADYLALHNEVDVMLDTFPYSGGTTTCHALWMGTPVVSLVGETPASRGGASLLNAIGLPQLSAESSERYLDIALNLATDHAALKDLHAGLRERMLASPLMDIPRFTRNLEAAYREMWKSWCESR
jgi:protein O-GlcNAc transferase